MNEVDVVRAIEKQTDVIARGLAMMVAKLEQQASGNRTQEGFSRVYNTAYNHIKHGGR